jgi:hypothetical protein
MNKGLVSGLLLMAGVFPAHAAFVELNGSNAIGIQGLEVGGAFYDVAFDFTIVGSTPASGDLFVGDEAGAHAATNAIVAALNPTAATSVGTGFSGNGSLSFVVPYSYADPGCGDQGSAGLCAWSGANTTLVSGNWGAIPVEKNSDGTVEFARFTPANAVPVPSAAYLFLSGLASMKWAVTRKRRGSSNRRGAIVRGRPATAT